MRVLLWMIEGDRIPGGHRIQFEQTCIHLRRLGVDVSISFADEPAIDEIDIVHGFGLPPSKLRMCRGHNLPVLLSTIYCNKRFYLGQHIRSSSVNLLKQRVRMALVFVLNAFQGTLTEKCEALLERVFMMRISYEMADMLLPNSESEARTIRAELDVTTPHHVVPNAVNSKVFFVDESEDGQEQRDSVLYVARFEPHKNQLGLIEALRHTNFPVVLVGHAHPDHSAYYERCKRSATRNIKILPGVPHEELRSLYLTAKVHVLPSWFETTGLVSLEAALCGCNIVTTNRGYARDYFLDMAWYCNPEDPASIRRAVDSAYGAPYNVALKHRILENFTWTQTANATLEAYESVLRSTKNLEL